MATLRKIMPEKGKEISVKQDAGPFAHMEDFFENFLPRRWMENFMEPKVWKRPFWSEFEGGFEHPMMRLDVLDHEADLFVRAEMPGVRKEDIEITIAGEYLTIEAKREFKEEEKKETFYRSELGYGKLMRTVYLPNEVDPEKVKATLKEGILEVTLPKVKAVTRHTVKVA